MYRLYARPGWGSAAVEAMLALCEAPHEVVDVPRDGDGKLAAWYHEINPLAEVPTLILPDHSVMTESSAMLILLGEAFPGAGLAPAAGAPLRARFLRWMAFLATSVYGSDLRYYYAPRFSSDPAAAPGIKAKAAEQMARQLAVAAQALGEGPFMLGERMSALDLYLAMLTSWAPDVPVLYASHANLERLCARVAADPVVARVWERNGM
jgi:glutathione S-transferase